MLATLAHYAVRCSSRIEIAVAMLFAISSLAHAQTYNESISVSGGGTLAYEYQIQTGSCGGAQQTSANTWQNFSYTPSGGSTTGLGGSIDYIYPCGYYGINGGWDYVTNDYSSNNWSNELDMPYGNCTIAFYASAGGAVGSASISCPPSYQGYINPKYLVVGVTYAPPGPSPNTWIQYFNSKLVGTTASIKDSFTSGITTSVSVSFGGKIPAVGSGKITTTYDSGSSQTNSTTSTVSTSMQSSYGFTTYGTPDYFAPVNNDYDIIWVWLNPAVILTVSSGTAVWNGYGYDSTDGPGIDIVGIAVGYLNGHFGAMPAGLSIQLARDWASSQMFAAGQGPGLTSTDLVNILAADPFSSSAYGPNVITYTPPSTETADHRFSLASCDGVTMIPYDQGEPSRSPAVYTCSFSYTNMSAQAKQISKTASESYSADSSFSGSAFLSRLNAEMKTTYSLSWTTDAQLSISSTTTSTASISVQGPPCNNATFGVGPCIPEYDSSGNEPTDFAVYQDNIYGTIMLAPIHYY